MAHYHFGRHIGGIHRIFQQYLETQLSDVDLKPLEFRILIRLVHHNGISQEDVAEWLVIDKSVIARKVKKLMDKGYVTRQVNEQDRRAYQLYLTDKGSAYIPEINRILDEWEELIMENVPVEERERFHGIMQGIFDHARSAVKDMKQGDKNESKSE